MKNKNDKKLNLNQEKFCQLYANDEEFFANGVASYIEVYKPKQVGNWYKSACASSSRLLANVKVCQRINELLELGGLNDQFVDKQLNFLITQYADFKSKLGAIREYNALKARIVKKIEGDINFKDKSTDEIKKAIADEIANLIK